MGRRSSCTGRFTKITGTVHIATAQAAAAIAGAEIRVLDGHAQFAHKTDPAMVSQIVSEIIAS